MKRIIAILIMVVGLLGLNAQEITKYIVAAESDPGITFQWPFRVIYLPVEFVFVVLSSATLKIGDALSIQVEMIPSNASVREVDFIVDDTGNLDPGMCLMQLHWGERIFREKIILL